MNRGAGVAGPPRSLEQVDRAWNERPADAVTVAQREAKRSRCQAVVDRDHGERHGMTGIRTCAEDGERAGSLVEDLRIDARRSEVGSATRIRLVHELLVVVLAVVEVELEVRVAGFLAL